MDERNGWWLTILALAMAALGGASIWCLAIKNGPWNTRDYTAAVVSALICTVGLIFFLNEVKYHPDEPKRYPLAAYVKPYAAGWHTLWNQKWLLWLFGCVLGVNVVGSVVSGAISVSLARVRFAGEDLSSLNHASENYHWWQIILGEIVRGLSKITDFFTPRSGINVSSPVIVLGALIFLVWALPRLTALAQEREYAVRVTLVKLALIILVLAGAVVFVLWIFEMRAVFAELARLSPPGHISYAGRQHPYIYVGAIYEIVAPAIAEGLLMAGLVGCLFRLKEGDSNVGSTFFRDAAKYFAPMLWVYLALGLIRNAFFYVYYPIVNMVRIPAPLTAIPFFALWLLQMLLIFAAFAVVMPGLSAWEALSYSLRYWKKNVWRILPFLAVGCAFAAVPLVLVQSLMQFIPGRTSPLQIPAGIILTAVHVLLYAWICLSVWEFYSSVSEPVEADVSQA